MKEKLLFGQSLNEKIPPPEELFATIDSSNWMGVKNNGFQLTSCVWIPFNWNQLFLNTALH